MNWQSKLRVRSRDPAFLWKMVIAIIGTGVVVGWIVEQVVGTPLGHADIHADQKKVWQHLEALAQAGQWWDVWWKVPQTMASDLHNIGLVVLAIFAGCCWLTFVWQVLRVSGPLDWRVGATLLAVALGVLSIWLTCFLILWQELRWGLIESPELVPGLRFFILGVGLREEFAKLVCLLPLMAILVPKRSEIVALMVSACVGLGFAIEENIGYYWGSQGTDTLGRFLTANPMHMSMTGLIGLAVYRAFRDPKNWAPQAVATFFLLVLVHGIYDAAIVLPDLQKYSLAGTIAFALVIYQFFHELRTLRVQGRDTISLTATFLCAISLLTAVTFVYVSAIAGTSTAADTLVTDIIGTGVMVYLFLREMPETLVSV